MSHPRHRRLIVLRGPETAAEARALLGGARDGLWVGDGIAPDGFTLCAPAGLRRVLGQSYDAAVVLDPDAEALGRAQGCVRGGGALVIRLTSEAPATRWRQRLEAAIRRAGGGVPSPLAPFEGRPGGTAEQAAVVAALAEVFDGPPGGAAALLADRGRGKSAALGMALAGRSDAMLTGPGADAVAEAQRFAPGLVFTPLAALLHGEARPTVIAVDEAAQIPVPALRRLVERHPQARFAFASTARGYEGTGRGFVLRFMAWLEGAAAVRRLTLVEPIRWAAGDPVERFAFDALLLDAEPSRFEDDPGPLRAVRLDRDALAADEDTLRAVFGLLVHAHYRTTPRDLELLLDGPGVRLFALQTDEPAPRIAAVNLLVDEGRLPADVARGLALGTARVRGQALAETLAADAGRPDAARLSMLRSVRIATHPALRQRGLAARLTEAVHAAAAAAPEGPPDLFGTLFGATAALLGFRRSLGYRLVRLGVSGGRRAGEPAAVMIRPVSAAAQALVADLRGALARDLPRQLGLMGGDQTLDPALVRATLAGLPDPAPLDDTARDAIVASYAFGPRAFETAALPILRFVEAHRAALAALAPAERDLIEARVVEGRPWSALAGALGGVRPAMRGLRRAVRALVQRVDPTLGARFMSSGRV